MRWDLSASMGPATNINVLEEGRVVRFPIGKDWMTCATTLPLGQWGARRVRITSTAEAGYWCAGIVRRTGANQQHAGQLLAKSANSLGVHSESWAVPSSAPRMPRGWTTVVLPERRAQPQKAMTSANSTVDFVLDFAKPLDSGTDAKAPKRAVGTGAGPGNELRPAVRVVKWRRSGSGVVRCRAEH
jgi:hypothetical protein